jgi:pSer/pThr/pTyr-binding forkhead associated (FHA) protein
MPRLYVLSGKDIGDTHDFEQRAVLGRAKESDVRLHATSVSRRHARIENAGGRWVISDLGSSNGVFVRGRRIKDAYLDDGDVFRLGDVELRFREEGAGGAPSARAAEPAATEDVAATRVQPAPTLEPPSAPDLMDTGDFELEGDWADEASAPVGSPTRPATTPRAASAGSDAARSASQAASRRASALEADTSSGGVRATASGRRVLQYNRQADREGFFAADVGQRTTLARWSVYLLVAGLVGGIAYGAFFMTRTLRQSQTVVTGEGP